MEKNYTTYTTSDFIKDTYFLEWVLNDGDAAQSFWSDFIESHPEKRLEIDKAIEILHSIESKQHLFSNRENIA